MSSQTHPQLFLETIIDTFIGFVFSLLLSAILFLDRKRYTHRDQIFFSIFSSLGVYLYLCLTSHTSIVLGLYKISISIYGDHPHSFFNVVQCGIVIAALFSLPLILESKGRGHFDVKEAFYLVLNCIGLVTIFFYLDFPRSSRIENMKATEINIAGGV